MLVVSALIALLMALLLPSLKRSVRIAASTVCLNNLRGIYQALELYRMDNDGWLPDVPPLDDDGSSGSPVQTAGTSWRLKLVPRYISDAGLLTCPEDPLRPLLLRPTTGMAEPDDPRLTGVSYGINGLLLSAGDGYLANLDLYQPSRPLDTILMADLGPDTIVLKTLDDVEAPVRNNGLLSWDDGYDPLNPDEPDSAPWVTTRHGLGVNMMTIGGIIREVQTAHLLNAPINTYYAGCAGGGCALCTELRLPHYTFARDRMYWWTGRVPAE